MCCLPCTDALSSLCVASHMVLLPILLNHPTKHTKHTNETRDTLAMCNKHTQWIPPDNNLPCKYIRQEDRLPIPTHTPVQTSCHSNLLRRGAVTLKSNLNSFISRGRSMYSCNHNCSTTVALSTYQPVSGAVSVWLVSGKAVHGSACPRGSYLVPVGANQFLKLRTQEGRYICVPVLHSCLSSSAVS